MPAINFTNSDPQFAQEQVDLERKLALAQMLQKQAMQPLEAQQGMKVQPKISPLQGIAQVLQGYMAGKMGQDADQSKKDLIQRQAQALQGATDKYMGMRDGMPAQAPTTPNDDEGNTNPMVAATAGDPRKALAFALSNPNMQNSPLVKYDVANSKPVHLKADESLLDPMDNYRTIAQAPKTMPEKPERPPMFKQVGLSGNKEQEHISYDNGKTWQPVPGSAPTDKFNPKQPVTNVNVSTEKGYGDAFGKGVATDDLSKRASAQKSAQTAASANQVLSLLSDPAGIYTGTAANFKLGFDKAISATGLKDSSGRAINTEQLVAGLAQKTLDHVKDSGLGSGNGFTDKDLKFLQDAQGGRITLEAGSIRRLAELSYRASQESANMWNVRVKGIPKSAIEGTGIDTNPVQLPAMFKTPDATTPKRRKDDGAQPRVVDW